jgi:hypothetical protein
VCDAGAIPALVELLLIDLSDDMSTQAVWCLGNIAGDQTPFRDAVHAAGALHPLLALLKPDCSVSIRRQGSWLLRTLSRGRPLPEWAVVADAFEWVANVVLEDPAPDVETLGNACWALSSISDCADPQAQAAVLEHEGLLGRVKELLSHPDPDCYTPALRVLGNLARGNDEQTQAVVDCGSLPMLVQFLAHPTAHVRKEASHILSNIAAGTRLQVQSVLDSGALGPLIRMGDNQAPPFNSNDVRAEALWALCNMACGGNDPQLRFLLDHDGLRCMWMALPQRQPRRSRGDGALFVEMLRGIRRISDMCVRADPAIPWPARLIEAMAKEEYGSVEAGQVLFPLRVIVDCGQGQARSIARQIVDGWRDAGGPGPYTAEAAGEAKKKPVDAADDEDEEEEEEEEEGSGDDDDEEEGEGEGEGEDEDGDGEEAREEEGGEEGAEGGENDDAGEN